MAEQIDNFDTDPTSRWTARSGTIPGWDDPNDEFDVVMANRWQHLYNTSPGDAEHACQVTFQMFNVSADGNGGPAVRGLISGDVEGYQVHFFLSSDICQVHRRNSDNTTTQIGANFTFLMASQDFITCKLLARGAVGSAVDLEVTLLNHGTTKPSMPVAWLTGTPDFTRQDSAASGTRHDSSSHIYCGIGGHWGGADVDTRHCSWKAANVSDLEDGGASGFRSRIAGGLVMS